MKSADQIGEDIFRMSKTQNRRNTWCIARATPHKDCARIVQSDFSPDEAKTAGHTLCMAEGFCEIWRKICKQGGCKAVRRSLRGVAHGFWGKGRWNISRRGAPVGLLQRFPKIKPCFPLPRRPDKTGFPSWYGCFQTQLPYRPPHSQGVCPLRLQCPA